MSTLTTQPEASGRGRQTRRRILDAAYELTLRHGFTATTMDRVLARVKLTKGAFFHHFTSKTDLSLVLVQRYADEGCQSLYKQLDRARAHSADPREQLLFYLDQSIVSAGQSAEAEASPAGCLFACMAYELEEQTDEVRALMRSAVASQISAIHHLLREVALRYPPVIEVDLQDVAEHIYAVYDGGLVMGRVLRDEHALTRQLQQVRDHMFLLFTPRS